MDGEIGLGASSSQKSLLLYKVLASQNCHTKIAQMGLLKQQNFIFVVPEARVQDQGVSWFGFHWGLSVWLWMATFALGPHRVFLMHS